MFNFRTATNKQFSAALKKTAGNAAKLQEEIHGLAMFALIQLNMHTNSTPLADLIAALPKGQRVQALIFWFKSFGACSYNEKENTFKFVNKESVRGADKLDANIAKAEANPYYEWSKEEVKPVFNFGVETIATLIKRAKNASEHPEKYRELDIDAGLLQALERTINDYTANQLTLVAALEKEAMQG